MNECVPQYAKSDTTLRTVVRKISVNQNMTHIVRPPVITSIKEAFSSSCVMDDCASFYNKFFCITKGVLILFDIFPNIHSPIYNVLKIIQKSFLGSS